MLFVLFIAICSQGTEGSYVKRLQHGDILVQTICTVYWWVSLESLYMCWLIVLVMVSHFI